MSCFTATDLTGWNVKLSPLVWPDVSFEIPDVPKVPDENLSAPASQTLMLVKEKVCKTESSSSSITSTNSWQHTPLSRMNRYRSDSADSVSTQPQFRRISDRLLLFLGHQHSLSGQLHIGEIQLWQSQRYLHMGQPCNRGSSRIQWQQSQHRLDIQRICCKPQPVSPS